MTSAKTHGQHSSGSALDELLDDEAEEELLALDEELDELLDDEEDSSTQHPQVPVPGPA